jgi:hypothetical protein
MEQKWWHFKRNATYSWNMVNVWLNAVEADSREDYTPTTRIEVVAFGLSSHLAVQGAIEVESDQMAIAVDVHHFLASLNAL